MRRALIIIMLYFVSLFCCLSVPVAPRAVVYVRLVRMRGQLECVCVLARNINNNERGMWQLVNGYELKMASRCPGNTLL